MGFDALKNTFKNLLPRAGTVEVITPTGKADPWKAYQGDLPNPLKTTKIDPNGDDNILLPLIGQIVDTSVAALLGDGIKIDVQGDGNEAAQEYLDAFFARSRLNTTVKKAALNGAVIGHSYVKLIIDESGDPERFQCLQSDTVTVATDARDCERAVSYTIRWKEYDASARRDIEHREVTKREGPTAWTIVEQIKSSGDNWVNVTDPVEWNFPYAPIFDCQNLTNARGYLGTPDATQAAIAQNQAINAVVSLCARLLRNHASPKTILSGMGNDLPNWKVDGAVLLPKDAQATQLEYDSAGATALLDLYKVLREALHTTTRTPEVASGKLDDAGAISGTALLILFRPLIEKTNEKRLHLAEMLEEMCLHVLEIGGFPGVTVDVVWPDTTPKSDTEEATSAQTDLGMGIVSKETIAKKRGYDWETEQEQMQAEAPRTPTVPSTAPTVPSTAPPGPKPTASAA